MNVLNHVADISLNKHAIIEASAGTGKTYTIGKLVIRIIRETNIPIEKILMVTFTEKATAELRDRIREYLEAEIAAENEPVILQKLKQAIGNYANAKIFTIHGFCQRTLQQYAFENRGYFDVEMVADRTLLQDVLNNLKRTWPGNEKWETLVKEYGYDLSTEETVIDLAMKIAPGFDELKPIPIDVQTEFVRLKEFDTNQALAEFDWLCQQKGHGPAFAKNKEIALLPYLEYVSLPSYEESLEFPNSWHGSGGIHGQVFKRKPNSLKQFSEELPNLTKMVALHESFAEVLVAQQRTFITQLVHILQKMALREKEQRGLISFNDMIGRLSSAILYEVENKQETLLESLREDFEIALIDEFQDTDARQWNIFKNIFMFGEKHRLMLIGDPKQAIYGFRGADIHTYELAKKELLELGDERTQIWSLATNYRTVPDLIENLNVAWQHFLPNQIAQVRPMPSDHMDPVRILSDNTGTYSFNFLEDEESMPLGSAGDLKYYYANKIAETCKTLLSPDALIFESKNLVQSLQASDICILVRGKNEVPYLEQALKIQEIPCSFYKKPGIYHSKAAMHFTVLIEGLIIQKSTYINRALLTCFFEYSPEEVLQLQETGQAINLWQELTEITRTKNWARFFHALFYKSGLLKRLKQEQEHRLLMDLKQITDVLCKSAIERNMDLEGLLRHFNNLKEEEGEEDFHQRETDFPMVQIMTMHASKGLEFPIVFIYGGFTQGVASPSYHKYYDEFEDRLVYDLACQNKEAHDREVIEENKRLFYVAMTRAKLKLFLPYYADELEERFKGSYSTLINDDLLQYMAKQDLEPNHEGYFSSGVPEMNTREKESDDFNLQPPKSLEDGALRARYIESFSGLSQQGDVLNWLAYSDASVDEAKVDDIEIGEQSNRGIGLPRGAHVGNVLHDTLEFIDFPTVMQAQSPSVLYANTEVEQLILNLMKKYRLPSSNTEGQSCFEMMCDQVWHILQTKLLLGDQVLQLGFLSEKDRKHELEFYYHAPENSYLKGFIDLLFRVGNNYYILDWKSNYSENGYTHDILFNEVMREHQYQLQYELYRLAVQEWFDTLGLKEAKLCGAIYIFARGMHVDNVAGHGYVFDDFSNLNNETTRTHLQQLLLKRIGGRA